ncbi:hypothetical protein QTP70_030771, partial [Hemibagrus guttatus]
MIVSPITWSEETLPPTNASTNTPSGCPLGSQYIPRARLTSLIHSTHTSLGTGHPGINETLSLLKDRFWWPNMAADVRRDIRLRLPCRKLSPRFTDLFTILRQINPVTYKLQLPPEYRIHPTFHVSLLKPHHPSVFPSTEPGGDVAEPPLPLLLDDGAAYGVKEILDSQRRGGQLEYLVDWEGYGPEERSWIPRDDILDPNLLETFHSTHPHRPAPHGR